MLFSRKGRVRRLMGAYVRKVQRSLGLFFSPIRHARWVSSSAKQRRIDALCRPCAAASPRSRRGLAMAARRGCMRRRGRGGDAAAASPAEAGGGSHGLYKRVGVHGLLPSGRRPAARALRLGRLCAVRAEQLPHLSGDGVCVCVWRGCVSHPAPSPTRIFSTAPSRPCVCGVCGGGRRMSAARFQSGPGQQHTGDSARQPIPAAADSSSVQQRSRRHRRGAAPGSSGSPPSKQRVESRQQAAGARWSRPSQSTSATRQQASMRSQPSSQSGRAPHVGLDRVADLLKRQDGEGLLDLNTDLLDACSGGVGGKGRSMWQGRRCSRSGKGPLDCPSTPSNSKQAQQPGTACWRLTQQQERNDGHHRHAGPPALVPHAAGSWGRQAEVGGAGAGGRAQAAAQHARPRRPSSPPLT